MTHRRPLTKGDAPAVCDRLRLLADALKLAGQIDGEIVAAMSGTRIADDLERLLMSPGDTPDFDGIAKRLTDYADAWEGPPIDPTDDAIIAKQLEASTLEHDDLGRDFDLDDDEDDGCGAWMIGCFSYYDCTLAGTEYCDFECPYGASSKLRKP